MKKNVVERMVSEHLRKERDHTHRLFALLMLEIWWKAFSPSLEKTP